MTSGRAALRESLILAQQFQSNHDIAYAIERFAQVAQRVNQPAPAIHLYWPARNINDSIGAWHSEDEAEFESDLAAFRDTLGESEFAAAIEQGRAMTMEQAIAHALEVSTSL